MRQRANGGMRDYLIGSVGSFRPAQGLSVANMHTLVLYCIRVACRAWWYINVGSVQRLRYLRIDHQRTRTRADEDDEAKHTVDR